MSTTCTVFYTKLVIPYGMKLYSTVELSGLNANDFRMLPLTFQQNTSSVTKLRFASYLSQTARLE